VGLYVGGYVWSGRWLPVSLKPETWQEETVAGANSTYSAPRLATIGNFVGIVAQGPRNSLDYYWAMRWIAGHASS
jgi:hypothetical protein